MSAATEDDGRKRILIVDDSQLIVELLTEVLDAPGRIIHIASSGMEAVGAARAFRPHVILLDVGLDDLDGFEVFRILKQDRDLDATQVVFMTGHAERGALEIARDLGAFDFMVKPIPIDKLEDVVRRAMEAPPRR